MNRRTFLYSAASATAALTSHAAVPRTPIVDTHTHCFAGKADARFPRKNPHPAI